MKKFSLLLVTTILIFTNLVSVYSLELNDKKISENELEAFVDGVVDANMKLNDIGGFVVSIVKDGKIAFQKGYGYEDYENNVKVNSKTSVFRVGSVSKLFTWTSIMQLYENGDLDLDTDINEYLDFKIEEKYSKPITIKNLLTHTAGFEDSYYGFSKKENDNIPELGDFLKNHELKRVFPPGEYSAYSNYGAALAGYIVERKSGIKFEEYIENKIFKPLEMKNSTAKCIYPDNILENLAHPLIPESGEYKTDEFEYMAESPSGAFGTTATDMANFMNAYLNDGIYKNNRILKKETIDLVFKRLFSNDDRVNGIAHGFYEKSSNDLQILGHGGDIENYHSSISLIPEENLGIFISTNSNNGNALKSIFLKTLLDKYYPEEDNEFKQVVNEKNYKEYNGVYLSRRSGYKNILKINNFLQSIKISSENDYLVVSNILGSSKDKFYETKEDIFENKKRTEKIVFQKDDNEKNYLFLNSYPVNSYKKTSFIDNPEIHIYLIIGIILISALWIAFKLINVILKKIYKLKVNKETKFDTFLSIMQVLNLVLICTFLSLVYFLMTTFPEIYINGEKVFLISIFCIPFIIILNSVIKLIILVKIRKNIIFISKIKYLAYYLLNIIFIFILYTYNLIGFNFL